MVLQTTQELCQNCILILPPPAYPSFVVVEPESSSSVRITWGQPSDITSTIVNYRITCSVAATTTSAATHPTQDNTTTAITLNDLYSYTTYNCCVAVIYSTLTETPKACNTTTTLEDGEEQISLWVHLVIHVRCVTDYLQWHWQSVHVSCTLVSWYNQLRYVLVFYLLTLFPSVPTGAPFRLQGNAINSSALHLSWQPPAQDELNGVLRLYGVTLRDARTGQLSQQNTTTSSIIISSLKPCTTYQCSVEAFTVGFGPASDEYIVQTHPQLSGQ